MPFSPSTYLTSQGWSGQGQGLRPGARAKPITAIKKKDLGGVGKDRDTSFAWWDDVFKAVAGKVEKGKLKESDAEHQTATGILSPLPPPDRPVAASALNLDAIESAQRSSARRTLYGRFHRGRVIAGTVEEEQFGPTAMDSVSGTPQSAAVLEDAEARRKREKKERKEQRRAQKFAVASATTSTTVSTAPSAAPSPVPSPAPVPSLVSETAPSNSKKRSRPSNSPKLGKFKKPRRHDSNDTLVSQVSTVPFPTKVVDETNSIPFPSATPIAILEEELLRKQRKAEKKAKREAKEAMEAMEMGGSDRESRRRKNEEKKRELASSEAMGS